METSNSWRLYFMEFRKSNGWFGGSHHFGTPPYPIMAVWWIGSVGKFTGSPHTWWYQSTMISIIHPYLSTSVLLRAFLISPIIAGRELQCGHPKLSAGCSALCTSRQAGGYRTYSAKKSDLTSESQPAQKRFTFWYILVLSSGVKWRRRTYWV